MIPLLDALPSPEAVNDTVTGWSDAAEKLTLIGLLLFVAVLEGLVIRFLARRLMAIHDRTEQEFRSRNLADEAERRARANLRGEHGNESP